MHGGYRRLASNVPVALGGTFFDPCESSLSKKPCFLESASIRPRGVAGLDGGTSHATCSLAACRRCRHCDLAASTLPDKRRSRRLPAAVAAHAGEAAGDRRPQVPQVRPPRHVRGVRPRCLGRANSAATRPRPIPNTPSATRATTVMAADRRRVGSSPCPARQGKPCRSANSSICSARCRATWRHAIPRT